MQTVFSPNDPHPVPLNAHNVYGVVSLIFWSIMLIVTLTYVSLVMRADNDGEGGIMALITLLRRWGSETRHRTALMLAALGVFGASLFFGDSMITPAISVLSAIEGIEVVDPDFEQWVVPITVVIIVVLFYVQRHGTAIVGRAFGPVMVAWFLAIGACGVTGIVAHPGILKALSPTYALTFIVGHFEIAFFALTAVVLAVTGAEALYADMGHFGRKAITRAWLFLVLPALALNYLGQGGAADRQPTHHARTLLPADPRLGNMAHGDIGHRRNGNRVTGRDHRGVLGGIPGRSHRLSTADTGDPHICGARGPDLRALDQRPADDRGPHSGARIPQLGTLGVRLRHGGDRHDHDHPPAVPVLRPDKVGCPVVAGGVGGGVLVLIDLLFVAANLTKVVHGAWLPLTIGIVAFTVMVTWHRGREIVTAAREKAEGPLDEFINEIRDCQPPLVRVPGAAVFLNRGKETAPLALRTCVEHTHVLHKHVMIVSIETLPMPRAPESERIQVDALGYKRDGIVFVTANYGYMEKTHVLDALRSLTPKQAEGKIVIDDASYFLSKLELVRGHEKTMAQWRKRLFIATSYITADAAERFGLPRDRTVIMGSRIEV